MAHLFHELAYIAANRGIKSEALISQQYRLDYSELAEQIQKLATGLIKIGIARSERVAVYLEKRVEGVAALFATSAAGAVFVPINPLLKAEQVGYILNDCNVRILVTSANRLDLLKPILVKCHDLHTLIVVEDKQELPIISGFNIVPWREIIAETVSCNGNVHRVIDSDMAAILYTSGSTGKPKGVVLSHRNLVTGAKSVSTYLKNNSEDRILSVLPLSFDYGLSQLTTAFYVGASCILINYLMPRDIMDAVIKEDITGLAAVPPLWIQLSQLKWNGLTSLRYITNSGGAMPKATLDQLRGLFPKTNIYLMYGLTEAFRSTYLPPEEIDNRPDSIGKAIPNAEVLVLREDGSQCAPGEPGELVHRGPLVSMGYWNDSEKTSACFRQLSPRQNGLTIPEIAVWSGDTVRMDDEGFLYFVGRRDDMIKTSGYRVSPTEIEEIIYSTNLVAEVAAVGVPHSVLGQAIIAIVVPRHGVSLNADILQVACKKALPAYMLPAFVDIRENSLLRNPNGKIDRKSLATELQHTFME